jgi:hypothetical protein
VNPTYSPRRFPDLAILRCGFPIVGLVRGIHGLGGATALH